MTGERFKEKEVTCTHCNNSVTIKMFPTSDEKKFADFKCPQCGEVLLTGEAQSNLNIELFNGLGFTVDELMNVFSIAKEDWLDKYCGNAEYADEEEAYAEIYETMQKQILSKVFSKEQLELCEAYRTIQEIVDDKNTTIVMT